MNRKTDKPKPPPRPKPKPNPIPKPAPKPKSILKPPPSKTKLYESTIAERVAKRRALQPRVKIIEDSTNDESYNEEEIEIPEPPIQKPSRSVLPSLQLPPMSLRTEPGPKSAPPEIVTMEIPTIEPEMQTINALDPPASGSDSSSEEEELCLTKEEIAKTLDKSIIQFNEYLSNRPNSIRISPRNWTTNSDGNDDEEIHKTANEIITGDHSEFSKKLDFY
ncbi:uncharacterized protein LOC127287616 [Leptopilina boulardi]|uniref:uncharacterized protein LOC127287616 n=1 Tax=Leptopilina boulardi TaxID=63433 RepID=UPI0021F61143|nr:uncharacterized protein LOC127287616 [Leptopilina boulardi]